MNNIREEILKALPTPKNHLQSNFNPLPKLREKYGHDEVYKVLGEMEDNGEIYWHELNQYSTVIKRTEKSFQITQKI